MTQSDLSTVVTRGDLHESLLAIRDRLAHEADACDIADDRRLVAILKELRSVLEAIEALPQAKEESRLDRISAGVSDIADARKHRRLAVADGSQHA